MCLYNYNNQNNNNNNSLNSEEKILLQQIYNSISVQDNQKALELTEQLIAIQSSNDKVESLQEALKSLR